VLVARFGASRTPVREAIKRLHERGFLSIERKGAARIREMDRGEIEELYALRLRLERAAAY
jgi:DNA-binding GntR family transcriptional regulator